MRVKVLNPGQGQSGRAYRDLKDRIHEVALVQRLPVGRIRLPIFPCGLLGLRLVVVVLEQVEVQELIKVEVVFPFERVGRWALPPRGLNGHLPPGVEALLDDRVAAQLQPLLPCLHGIEIRIALLLPADVGERALVLDE